MEHGQSAQAETDGAAHEEPAKRPAADALAHRMRPSAEQAGREQQAEEIAGGAAIVQRRAARAHGVAGEKQRGEKSAGHRLYNGRAV